MNISLNEIAERCGVSAMTVSRALDPVNCDKVKSATREKILEICDKYQFRPKFSAQALASGKTNTIGIIMPWVETIGISPTYGRFISHLTSALKNANYTLSLISVPNKDQKTIESEVARTFRSSQIDGFISLACFIGKQVIEEMNNRKFPVVTFSMPSDYVQESSGTCHVRIDSRPAITEMLHHLLAKGHRKIALILCNDRASRRTQEYSEIFGKYISLKTLGIKRDDFFVYDNALVCYNMVIDNWNRLKECTAWVVMNDIMAHGACEAIKSKGLVPGRDIAVTGFDNIEATSSEPFLTTIHPPLAQSASKCTQLLLAQIKQSSDVPANVILPAELIIRNSTLDYRRKEKS